MSRWVRVAPGQRNISLPNGRVHNEGDEVMLTDDEYRRVETQVTRGVLIEIGREPNYTTSVMVQHVLAGRAFLAGGPALDLPTNSMACWVMSNPADSGHNALITGVRMFTTSLVMVEFRNHAVAPGGFTLDTPFNANQAANASSVIEVRYGVGETGGTAFNSATCSPDAPYELSDVLLVLPPGQSLAACVHTMGNRAAANVSATIQYAQVPAEG